MVKPKYPRQVTSGQIPRRLKTAAISPLADEFSKKADMPIPTFGLRGKADVLKGGQFRLELAKMGREAIKAARIK